MVVSTNGYLVMIVDAKPKPSVRQLVDAKVEACKCLACEGTAAKRGLCILHYGRFRTALQETPRSDRHTFEARLIRDGKLLASRQGQRLDVRNIFRAEEA